MSNLGLFEFSLRVKLETSLSNHNNSVNLHEIHLNFVCFGHFEVLIQLKLRLLETAELLMVNHTKPILFVSKPAD